jgi:hypothetical protein
MKEEIVTFDIAVLAKEKGFNYMKSNCFGDNMAYNLDDPTAIPACRANVVIGYILAPTQSLLQKWLREKHFLDVRVERDYDGWSYLVEEFSQGNKIVKGGSAEMPDYGVEVEKGLQEALKLIKMK